MIDVCEGPARAVWLGKLRQWMTPAMKNKLDAARYKISTVTPDTPEREVDRMIHHLADTCSIDELAGLISEALDAEQQARKELAYAQARLSALVKARQHKRRG